MIIQQATMLLARKVTEYMLQVQPSKQGSDYRLTRNSLFKPLCINKMKTALPHCSDISEMFVFLIIIAANCRSES